MWFIVIAVQKVAGSSPGLAISNRSHTIIGQCKKTVFACLATDIEQDIFTYVFQAEAVAVFWVVLLSLQMCDELETYDCEDTVILKFSVKISV